MTRMKQASVRLATARAVRVFPWGSGVDDEGEDDV